MMSSKDDGKDSCSSSSNKKQKAMEMKTSPISVEPTQSPLAMFFPSITPSTPPQSNDQENVERSIAMFFFENKLDFSAARSSSYQSMIDAIGKSGLGFRGPSAETLKTTWLERIKSEVSLHSKDIEKEWATTGCTIIVETWTDNKSKALINFLVSSPSRTFFHKSVDASEYYKNVKCLSDLFDSVIQDFGTENVVQVIMDTTLNFTGIVNHILQNYNTIFVSPCASQCLNFMLDDFCKVDWVNRCILQAQTITKFIYNNSSVLDLMKKFTGGQDIIKTGVNKSVSNFLSLQCILKQKSRLKHMFNTPDLSSNSAYANRPQTLTCISIIEDSDFWRVIEECVAVSEPFLKVLREVSGGRPAVGFLYELMTRAKESIRTYFIMDEVKSKTFLDIVDKRWHNHMHSPLHSAAAFLNPGIQYNPEIKFIGSIKEDFFGVLEKLLPTDLRRDITNQIILFTKATGMFGCNIAKEAINTVPPGLWWEQFGDSAPVLQRVAIRILSQVCSSLTFERQWSAFQQIHSEKRNKIDKETLNDLIYINYNMKLARSMKPKATQVVDPIQLDDIDMTSEWVDETDSTSPTQWLDRFGSGLDGSDLNTRHFSASIFGANDHIFGVDIHDHEFSIRL